MTDTPAGDSLLLQRLILGIVNAVNNSALYPAGHPRIREAIDQLIGALESLLIARHQNSVTLMMVDDDLVVDQRPFRFAGLHLRGFLHAMQRMGVEGLTLARGLDTAECARFLGGIAERGTAVSTGHLVVGRVKLAFSGDEAARAAADAEAASAAAASDPDAGPESAGGRGGGAGERTAGGGVGPLRGGLTGTQLESAREAFHRFRTDRKGSLELMETLVWSFIDTLARATPILHPLAQVREHDELTYVHSVNVSLLVLGQARAFGYHGEPLKEIGMGALLHDIGKLSLPSELLNKPEPLDDREWALMRRHPELGAARLCELDATTTVPALVAYEHHLRYDGQPSYPLLRSPRRPILASAMTAVADTFDALQTLRPYDRARSRPAALAMLREVAGSRLDPLLVESFCRLYGPQPSLEAATGG